VPFRDVYIHALVRDEQGQKMSKSKGNVIDPLELMNKYGTDAFRFTLAAMAAMGRDIKLAEDRIGGYQSFVNKLWNAARFVQMNLSESEGPTRWSVQASGSNRNAEPVPDLGLADRWIYSRLAATIAEARDAIDAYRYNDYANGHYQIVWHEFSDWYIEMSKLALNVAIGDDREGARRRLAELLDQILLLLHPVMPFVTEEIWQVMGNGRPSIMIQQYPQPRPEWIEGAAEKQMEFLMGVVRAIRNLRTELNCPPGKEVKAIFCGQQADLDFLHGQEPFLRSLARVGRAEYRAAGDGPKGAATAVVGATEVYLPLDDLINLDEERVRLAKEVAKMADEIARVQKKLSNSDFVAKAKEEVIQKERDKALQFEEKIRTLRSSLEKIQDLQAGRN
jgi:valyl-tRNA synthetase